MVPLPLFTLLLKPLLPMLLSYTGDGTPALYAFASGGYFIAVYMAEMLGHYIDLALIQQKKAMNMNL